MSPWYVLYLDNIVMTAENQGDIKRAENKMFGSSEIKINSAKTNILICARDPLIKPDLCAGNPKLHQVHKTINLWCEIISDSKNTRETNQRVTLKKIAKQIN